MLAEIPPDDLRLFARLNLIQPFGYRRDEFNTALICATVASSNPWRMSGDGFDPLRYMPYRMRSRDVLIDIDEHNDRIARQLAGVR